MRRKILTTSTSCLDYINHVEDIDTIRIKVDINGKLYEDGTDITAEDFYAMLTKDNNFIPKTTQPSIGQLLEKFEDYAKQGYTDLFITTISSKMSGTYNTIRQCSEILKDTINIFVYDTYTVNYNEGTFALTAAKMFREGKSLEEVCNRLDYLKEHNTILFAVDDLAYLVKNGRLSGAAGFVGKYLKIKPLLEVCPDGTIQVMENIRTTKKALRKVCDKAKEYTKDHKNFTLIITYTGVKLKDYFITILNENGINDFILSPCTPIVGCHVGPDAIGLGIFIND